MAADNPPQQGCRRKSQQDSDGTLLWHGPSFCIASFYVNRAIRRGKAELDRSTLSRDASGDLPNIISTPTNVGALTSQRSTQTASSDRPANRRTSSRISASIESSAGVSDSATGQVASQVLGRRPRSPPGDQSIRATSEGVSTAGTAALDKGTLNPKKRARTGGRRAMASNSHADNPSNGELATNCNGSHISIDERLPKSMVTNGIQKPALGANGSLNGKVKYGSNKLRPTTYCGHDAAEVTRLVMQALSDLGYPEEAESVGKASGLELEDPTVTTLKNAVLNGKWVEAEQLLMGAADAESPSGQGNGIILDSGTDRNMLCYRIRQQKYLELLEEQDTGQALRVLRSELTPLAGDHNKVAFLSGLLVCDSAEDLRAKMNWDGANGESRRELLSQLYKSISPSVMLPEKRLGILLQKTTHAQISTCTYHTASGPPSLYYEHQCDPEKFPSELALNLGDVMEEVWKVEFSPDGSMLAACGKGPDVLLWDKNFRPLSSLKGHEGMGGKNPAVANISWSPDSSMLVTCSRGGYARLWNIPEGTLHGTSKQFSEPVSGCVWASDSKSFVIGSLDMEHSLVTFNIENDELVDWGMKHRVQDLCGSEDGRWIVAVDNKKSIHIYNGKTRELEHVMQFKTLPTSISISKDMEHLLVNKKDGEARMISLTTWKTVKLFLGHSVGEFLIRSSFGGSSESFVMSGSENGEMIIWNKYTGQIVQKIQAHDIRCNALAWNPSDPSMIASCGDDGSVKIWTDKERSRPKQEGNRFFFGPQSH